MRNFEFKQYVDIEMKIKVLGYKKSRPAPVCSNPSDPSFSDPGDDPGWLSVEFYIVIAGKEILITDQRLFEYLEDLLIDDIIQEGENEN